MTDPVCPKCGGTRKVSYPANDPMRSYSVPCWVCTDSQVRGAPRPPEPTGATTEPTPAPAAPAPAGNELGADASGARPEPCPAADQSETAAGTCPVGRGRSPDTGPDGPEEPGKKRPACDTLTTPVLGPLTEQRLEQWDTLATKTLALRPIQAPPEYRAADIVARALAEGVQTLVAEVRRGRSPIPATAALVAEARGQARYLALVAPQASYRYAALADALERAEGERALLAEGNAGALATIAHLDADWNAAFARAEAAEDRCRALEGVAEAARGRMLALCALGRAMAPVERGEAQPPREEVQRLHAAVDVAELDLADAVLALDAAPAPARADRCPPDCGRETFHYCGESGTHCNKHCSCDCRLCEPIRRLTALSAPPLENG